MQIKIKAIQGHRGELQFGDKIYPCALGKAGVTQEKREGDHASPAGLYPLRSVYYRADKLARPDCRLSLREISESDGWCDDPVHAAYNRPISLPCAARHETLWREDDLYDLIVVIGHNDDPPVPGKGSCIFMHVAKPGYEGTEGCVALNKVDLLDLLAKVSKETCMEIML